MESMIGGQSEIVTDSDDDEDRIDENYDANSLRPSTRARKVPRYAGGGDADSAQSGAQRLPLKRKLHPEEEARNSVRELTKMVESDQMCTVHCNSAAFGGANLHEMVFNFHDDPNMKTMSDVVRRVQEGFHLPSNARIEIMDSRTRTEANIDDCVKNQFRQHFILKVNDTVDFEGFSEAMVALPHQNLHNTLAKGNYTLLVSFCELIDNSVQATSGNPEFEGRKITISIALDDADDADDAASKIEIHDNGRGWDMPSEFTNLGYGTTQREKGEAPPEQARHIRDHLSGNISRYGVGGKFAEALLGNRYTLTTKTKGPVLHKVRYTKGEHLKFHKETLRAAVEGYSVEQTFSRITVEEVDRALFDQYRRTSSNEEWHKTLAQNLRTIYFLYLKMSGEEGAGDSMGVTVMAETLLSLLTDTKAWTPPEPAGGKKANGRGRKRKSPDNGIDSGCEKVNKAHSEMRKELDQALNSTDPRVKLKNLLGIQLELRFKHGPNEFRTVTAGSSKCRWDYIFGEAASDCMPLVFYIENPEHPGKKSRVLMFVLYFAQDGDRPSLAKMLEQYHRVDGSQNAGRTGYIWNGRYLPNEQLEPEFLKHSNAPKPCRPLERCYKRLYAVVFLDRHFQVQLNKQALDQNGKMYGKLQDEMKCPELCKALGTFVQGCNQAHDNEVMFSRAAGCKQPEYNENTNRTTHFQALIEQTNYNAEDCVAFNRVGQWKKPEDPHNQVGIIIHFEQEGREEDGSDEGFVFIKEVIGDDLFLPVKEFRLNRYKWSKITRTAFDKKKKELAKDLAVSVSWDDQPDGTVLAGDLMKGLAVSCESGTKDKNGIWHYKPMKCTPHSKLKDCKVKLGIVGPGTDAVFNLTLDQAKNKFVLETGAVDGNGLPLLTACGLYQFSFRLDNSVSDEFTKEAGINVGPKAVSRVEFVNEEQFQTDSVALGQEIPAISLRLFDEYNNVFDFRDRNVSLANTAVLVGGVVDSQHAKAKEVDGEKCEVTGLKIGQGSIGEWTLRLALEFAHITTAHAIKDVRLTVSHGPPAKISRVQVQSDPIFTNLKPCPKLEFEVQDESGHVCKNFNGHASLMCPALDRRVDVPIGQGKISFTLSSEHPLKNPLYATGYAPEKKTTRKSGRNAAKNSGVEVVKPKNADGIIMGEKDFFMAQDTVMIHVRNVGEEPAVLASVAASGAFTVKHFERLQSGELKLLEDEGEAIRAEKDGVSPLRGRAFVDSEQRFAATIPECRGRSTFWSAAEAWVSPEKIPFDVFVFEMDQQPKRQHFADKIKLHHRELIEIKDSREPHAAVVVRETCRSDGECVYMPVSEQPLQGRPGSKFENLQLELRDETGTRLSAKDVLQDKECTLEVQWAGEDAPQFTPDGERICLPPLQVSESVAKESNTVKLKGDFSVEIDLVVCTNPGDPRHIKIDPSDSVVVVGKDTSFQFTVQDQRNLELAPQRLGDKWHLEIEAMTASDCNGRVKPVKVRKERFGTTQGAYRQEYTDTEAPSADLLRGGIFVVEHVRIPGAVGTVTLHVAGTLTVSCEDEADKDHHVKGEVTITLEAGEACRLALGNTLSVQGSSQPSSRPVISSKVLAYVERVVVYIVDECNNIVGDARSVLLRMETNRKKDYELVDFHGNGSFELSRDGDGYVLDCLKFKRSGQFSALLECKGVGEDLRIYFEVAESDRISRVLLHAEERSVTVGEWAALQVTFEREDHSAVEELHEGSLRVYICGSGHDLEFKDWNFDAERGVSLSVKMPTEFPEDNPRIQLSAAYSEPGTQGEVEAVYEDQVALTLRSGPFCKLNVSRNGPAGPRPTQGSQFRTQQPSLDEMEGLLGIPDLLLTACDAHGNRCDDFEEVCVGVELTMDEGFDGALELQPHEEVRVSALDNPHRVQLKAKFTQLQGQDQDYDFCVVFRVTARHGIDPCSEALSYRSNTSTQEKLEDLLSLKKFHEFDMKNLSGEIKSMQQEIRKMQFPEDVEQWKILKGAAIGELEAEIKRRSESQRGAMFATSTDLSNRPHGLVGIVAEMMLIRPGPQSEAIQEVMSSILGRRVSAALFESEEALEAHKQNEEERQSCRLARVYAMQRVIEPSFPRTFDKEKFEGCHGYLCDLADVDERFVTDQRQREVVKRLFRAQCGSAVVFDTYQQAKDYSRKMVETKKPANRAVGLNQPRDVIDGDGGQDLLQARSAKAKDRLGIRPFPDSSECAKMKQDLDEAKSELQNIEARKQHFDGLQQTLKQKEGRRVDLQWKLEEVKIKLKEIKEHKKHAGDRS